MPRNLTLPFLQPSGRRCRKLVVMDDGSLRLILICVPNVCTAVLLNSLVSGPSLLVNPGRVLRQIRCIIGVVAQLGKQRPLLLSSPSPKVPKCLLAAQISLVNIRLPCSVAQIRFVLTRCAPPWARPTLQSLITLVTLLEWPVNLALRVMRRPAPVLVRTIAPNLSTAPTRGQVPVAALGNVRVQAPSNPDGSS